jgi:hypothetical protein
MLTIGDALLQEVLRTKVYEALRKHLGKPVNETTIQEITRDLEGLTDRQLSFTVDGGGITVNIVPTFLTDGEKT